MIGYKLTLEQKNNIHGKSLSSSVFFNCTESTDGFWYLVLSSDDKLLVEHSDYKWILDLTKEEFIPTSPSSLPWEKD
jgi:hypothetical protein